MLPQISNNLAQASPLTKVSTDGLASNSQSIVVSAPPSNSATQSVGSPAPPFVSAVQVAEQPVSPAELKNVVNDANKVLQQSNKSLEFSVDADTQKPIVKLIDTETGDLIQQFPSEKMLAIANAIGQFQQGLLLAQKA